MKTKGLYRDFFFHFDILVMSSLFIGIAAYNLTKGITWMILIYFIMGLITFMFSEYITHRYFFHLKTPNNPYFLKILKRLHYDHHSDPNNLKLLFLPVWFSIPNLTVLASIFYLITTSFLSTLSFSLGLILMLLIYEWKHYIAHRPIRPKTKLGIWVKKTHMLHHFKNENYWYGVSTPFVDVLFGTLKDEKLVDKSQTAKDLENRAK